MRASKLSYSLSPCQERDMTHDPNVNRLSQTDHGFFSLQTLLN